MCERKLNTGRFRRRWGVLVRSDHLLEVLHLGLSTRGSPGSGRLHHFRRQEELVMQQFQDTMVRSILAQQAADHRVCQMRDAAHQYKCQAREVTEGVVNVSNAELREGPLLEETLFALMIV